ncbi:MAG: tetratricopeptide repeat protein [Polyangiaceae bacterium]
MRLGAAVAATGVLIAVSVGIGSLGKNGCKGPVCAPRDVQGCLTSCDKGSAPSCRYLGEMYERGDTEAPKDAQLARRAYARGCDRSDAEACAALAEMELDGAGGLAMPDLSLDHAKSACEHRVPIARGCHVLARIYETGAAGVTRDVKRASLLYEQSCQDAYGPSCTRLGELAAGGPDKNTVRAAELWQTACDRADGRACLLLGDLRASSAKRADAEHAYGRGCDAGIARACGKLAMLLWPTTKGDPAWRRVREALDKGCSAQVHDPVACEKLGELYTYGRGVTRDARLAQFAFANACSKVDATETEGTRACGRAQTYMGRASKDARSAVLDFENACERRDPWGCVELGIRYEQGAGVPRQDASQARALYERACAPVDAPFDALDKVACARAKERQGAATSEPAAARALFEASCQGGSGHGCLRLAELALAATPEGKRTRESMDAVVGLYIKGCSAAAPAAEACLEGARIERSRGSTAFPYHFVQARELETSACELDPQLPICPR